MPNKPEHKPIDQWLGISWIKNTGTNIFQMLPTEKHLGNPLIKAIHGGVVTMFLERSANMELSDMMNAPKPIVMISTNINFLRSAKMKPLFGSAKVLKLGRRLAIVDVIAWQDKVDVPVAKATVSFKL